jgi:hypothetical protein
MTSRIRLAVLGEKFQLDENGNYRYEDIGHLEFDGCQTPYMTYSSPSATVFAFSTTR